MIHLPGIWDIIRKYLPRGENIEYRVIAVNKAGEGLPSNTVLVVL